MALYPVIRIETSAAQTAPQKRTPRSFQILVYPSGRKDDIGGKGGISRERTNGRKPR
jgi:hypothetical protein